MSNLKHQMREDKAIRNAAKALLDADVAHVKNVFSRPSLTERAATNLNDSAHDVFDKASSAANDHKGFLAAIVGALLIWFARNPIVSLFEADDSDEAGDSESVTAAETTTQLDAE